MRGTNVGKQNFDVLFMYFYQTVSLFEMYFRTPLKL